MARKLTPDERDLWQRVAQATRRLRPMPDPAVPPALPDPPRLRPDPGAPVPRRGPVQASPARVAIDLAPTMSEALAQAPLKLNRGVHQRLVRGKLVPESRIDLHGMTLAQAQPALRGFLLAAQARGERLVLVITGKGSGTRLREDPFARPIGALKHEVPHWLHSPPLSTMVLDVREAHRSHGGGGAYYVVLRRRS